MDLYEFHQTTDLANLTWQRSIRGIYEMLKTEIMTWVGCLLCLSYYVAVQSITKHLGVSTHLNNIAQVWSQA